MGSAESPNTAMHTAIGDICTLLAVAHEVTLALTAEELHCTCYFGRIVASALEDTALPYSFTYGSHGGPFANSIHESLSYVVEQGLVAQAISEPFQTQSAAYLTNASLFELLPDLIDPSDVFSAGSRCIAAVGRALRSRPVALVFNAIHFEPNLYIARSQRLRVGLPLDDESSIFGTWLRELAAMIESRVPGRGKEPDLLVPITLDALATFQAQQEL